MSIDNLLAGVIVNVASSLVISLAAYIFGYKKLSKKINKLDNEIVNLKMQSTNQVSQTYETILKEYNQELDKVNEKLKNNQELYFSGEDNTQQDYNDYVEAQGHLTNRKGLIIREMERVANEYVELSNKIKSNWTQMMYRLKLY